MARANRWSMSDRLKFFLIGLVVFGVFVAVFGAGLDEAPLAGLGVVLALLGPTMVIVARVRGGKEYVYGVVDVQEVSPPPLAGHFGRAEFQLVVHARGVNGVPVHVRDAAVPTSKWPEAGARLPVMVAVDDPRRVKILWAEVATHRQVDTEPVRYADPEPLVGVPVGGDVEAERYDFGPYPPVRTDDHRGSNGDGVRQPMMDDTPTLTDLPPVVYEEVPPADPEPQPAPAAEPVPEAEPVPAPEPEPALATGQVVGPHVVRAPTPQIRRRPSPRPRRPADDMMPAAPPAPDAASPADPARSADPEQAADSEQPADPEQPAVATGLPDPSTAADAGGQLPVRVPAPRPYMADFGTGARPVVQLGDDAPATPPQATEPEPVGSESAGLESLAPESGPRRTGGATLEFILRESEPAPPPPPRYSDEVERPPNANGAVAQFLPVGSTGPLAAPAGSVAGINGVSVTLIVADLERSRRFYRDIIGMDEVDSSAQTSVLAFGDAGVVLRQVSDMAPVDRRVMHLNLEVADVTRAYERLHARGVEFVHKPRVVAQGEQLELCSAMFRDPDGHAVTLMRWEIRR